jgi:hypothetical protein
MLAIPTHQLLGNIVKIQQISHDISRHTSPVMCQFVLIVQVRIIHHLDYVIYLQSSMDIIIDHLTLWKILN